jgi:hypothetical protein
MSRAIRYVVTIFVLPVVSLTFAVEDASPGHLCIRRCYVSCRGHWPVERDSIVVGRRFISVSDQLKWPYLDP